MGSLGRRWLIIMTKLNIKEAVGRTSLKKKCHGDVDYSRNMKENLIDLSFFALNQCLE